MMYTSGSCSIFVQCRAVQVCTAMCTCMHASALQVCFVSASANTPTFVGSFVAIQFTASIADLVCASL
jgi:hypothetical protein